MGQALYRAYRSKKLSEIVGQEHITTALARALALGTVAHAYLFTGPRGVGKTSIARILAHEINGLPYDDDMPHHLDIIEIDAASNRRIDEIRDLRDKVHIAPAIAKYKVYIIDEVHMLTKEAFNALLKTLEEPPAHVIFILATTEVHKLPETIISRTQRFTFKPVKLAKVTAHLRTIAEAEKIAIDDDALGLIAAHGEGSFRDSISLLDQVRNSAEQVSLVDVQTMLGIPPGELIITVAEHVAAHDTAGVVHALEALQDQGFEPAQIAKQLSRYWREALLAGQATIDRDVVFMLLRQLLDVPAASDPGIELELALIEASMHGAVRTAQATITPPQTTSAQPSTAKTQPATKHSPKNEPTPQKATNKTPETDGSPAETDSSLTASKANRTQPQATDKTTVLREPTPPTQSTSTGQSPTAQSKTSTTLDPAIWQQALANIRQQYNTLYGIARMAQPRFEPGAVVLVFAFPFHQKRLNDPKNREILAQTIETISGQLVQVRCEVGEIDSNTVPPITELPPTLPPADETVHSVASSDLAATSNPPAGLSQQASQLPAASPTRPTSDTDTLATISNIFGESELLES